MNIFHEAGHRKKLYLIKAGVHLTPLFPTVRLLPGRVRLQAEVFYFTSSCNASLDELRQNFITRLSNSTWKDACVNVPTCTAENVKVRPEKQNGQDLTRGPDWNGGRYWTGGPY